MPTYVWNLYGIFLQLFHGDHSPANPIRTRNYESIRIQSAFEYLLFFDV